MERIVTNPIHLPCPDMAGCENPDPNKTANSLRKVAELRRKFAEHFPKKRKPTFQHVFVRG